MKMHVKIDDIYLLPMYFSFSERTSFFPEILEIDLLYTVNKYCIGIEKKFLIYQQNY